LLPAIGVMRELKIFSGQANRPLAKAICNFLHLPLGEVTLGKFPDGENYCKIEEDIRGRDVFLVQPTCPPVNDNLVELLIMIDSCKRASAARITTVIPYFGYARQDRKDEGRVPITAKLVANLITRSGSDRVLTMDLHSPQIQGFFDVPVDNLYAAPVLNDFVEALGHQPEDRVVVSPDVGSIKRAIGHAKRLGAGLAIVDKRRDNAHDTRQEHLIGEPVDGKVTIMFDDMVTTGGSIAGASQKLKDSGAKEIYVAITHGVFCGRAIEKINESPITVLAVTDSIPLPPEKMIPKIKVLTVAPLLAEAIKRIHHDQSISILFDKTEQ
jgi:ribose-phosphate pyrophosphokinase